jgi:glycosyltransferase involved in cell wall biosynthesis
MTPPVSVIMPVYNAERYLSPAIESILAQTFCDFEVIALDDGSTDSSPEILARYAKQDRRVRVFRRPQATLGALLNEGLREARGDYIARMDADDVSRPIRFEQQLHFLDTHPDVGIVGAQALAISPEGHPIRPLDHPLDHDGIEWDLLSGNGAALRHPAVMMRADVIRKVGGYSGDLETAEDVDLYLRVAEVARLANLPETLLEYRYHPSSINSTRRPQQIEDMRDIIGGALQRRGYEAAPPQMNTRYPRGYRNPAYLRLKWSKQALLSGFVRTSIRQFAEALRADPAVMMKIPVLYRSLCPAHVQDILDSYMPSRNPNKL